MNIPWMLMTGTKDVAPIGDADMKSRLAVFPALPPGGKYELVLYGAEHSAFTRPRSAWRYREAESESPPGNPRPEHGFLGCLAAGMLRPRTGLMARVPVLC